MICNYVKPYPSLQHADAGEKQLIIETPYVSHSWIRSPGPNNWQEYQHEAGMPWQLGPILKAVHGSLITQLICMKQSMKYNLHEDIMACKRFVHNWPFLRGDQ